MQHLYENGDDKLCSLRKLSSLVPNMCLLISFPMDTPLFQALFARRMPRDFSNSPGQWSLVVIAGERAKNIKTGGLKRM
jgi:hypothetical protein